MKGRYVVLAALAGAAVMYAATSYGGPSGVAPHVQTGRLLSINGEGLPRAIGFVFQPDGKSADQNGSPTGTRSMAWPGSELATCDASGEDCTWQQSDQPTRCLKDGARVEIAWITVRTPALYNQLIAWVKCLGP